MRLQSPPGSPLHYFGLGLYPVILTYPVGARHKIPAQLWAEIVHSHGTQSLRVLARKYNVSHESIRRIFMVSSVKLETKIDQNNQ